MEDNECKSRVRNIKDELIHKLNLENLICENEKTLYNLFNNSNDLIIIFEMNYDGMPDLILEANYVACNKLGYTREEFLKLSSKNLINSEDYFKVDKIKEDLLLEQYVFFKMGFLTKSKEIVPAEINASIFRTGGKKIILSIARDITEQKVIEKRLMKNNSELKIALNELKMLQDQLIQQEKLAAIGQLAAGVAHEINNPLGYIYSNIGTSRQYLNNYKKMFEFYKIFIDSLSNTSLEGLDSKIKEIKTIEKESNLEFISNDIEDLYDDVEDGLKKISGIVTNLKTFSRVDGLEDLEEYDLNQGIKNTLTMAKNEIKYYACIEEQLNDIPLIKAKGSQIDQVLLNIILNAVHAIRSRELNDLGLIKIKTYKLNGYIFCEIEDNGIGIKDLNVKKIFDPFFTTKVTGEGTGLGLSIAYDIIVNKCDGEILVESIPEVKTKFTIKLPIK